MLPTTPKRPRASIHQKILGIWVLVIALEVLKRHFGKPCFFVSDQQDVQISTLSKDGTCFVGR